MLENIDRLSVLRAAHRDQLLAEGEWYSSPYTEKKARALLEEQRKREMQKDQFDFIAYAARYPWLVNSETQHFCNACGKIHLHNESHSDRSNKMPWSTPRFEALLEYVNK